MAPLELLIPTAKLFKRQISRLRIYLSRILIGPRSRRTVDQSSQLRFGALVALRVSPALGGDKGCRILEHETRRLVVDQTGLKDSYVIELQWARDVAGGTPEPDTSRPSLFTA